MIGPVPICLDCVHYEGVKAKGGITCKAFRDSIPRAILVSQYDHRQPYPGDNGIQFEPIEEPKPK